MLVLSLASLLLCLQHFDIDGATLGKASCLQKNIIATVFNLQRLGERLDKSGKSVKWQLKHWCVVHYCRVVLHQESDTATANSLKDH